MEDKQNDIIFYKDDNVWLNVNSIATLFDVQRPAIVKHINNIYVDEELEKIELVPLWNKFNLKELEK